MLYKGIQIIIIYSISMLVLMNTTVPENIQIMNPYIYAEKFFIFIILLWIWIECYLIFMKNLNLIGHIFKSNFNALIDIFKPIKKIFTSYKSISSILIISFCWISFIVYLVTMQKRNEGWNKLISLKDSGLSLNEWGDFSAGFIAPLALVWLTYSIYYQKKEFENVQKSLKDQVTELALEKYHMSFDRYTTKIENIILKLEDTHSGTIDDINNSFILSNANTYAGLASDIKKIAVLDKNIVTLLSKQLNNPIFEEALTTLKEQYESIYYDNLKSCKEILLKIYFLISVSDVEVKQQKIYDKFEKYNKWLSKDKKDKIKELIDGEQGETLFFKKIDPAFSKITNKLELLD